MSSQEENYRQFLEQEDCLERAKREICLNNYEDGHTVICAPPDWTDIYHYTETGCCIGYSKTLLQCDF